MATTESEVKAVPPPGTDDQLLSEKAAALNLQEGAQDARSKASSFKDAPEAPIAEPTKSQEDVIPDELAPKGKTYTLIPHALPKCKPTPRPELTADQTQKYEAILTLVKAWESIPTTSKPGAPTEPIDDTDRIWLTRDCLLRYLRATKWNVAEAEKRVLATLTWYREYGVRSKITADHVSPENETGKQVLLGFDNGGRPCLYLNPGKQNTSFKEFGERQNQGLVFMLERVIDLMEPGQESTALLINYKDSSSKGNPPLSQGREVLGILQQHYPERLGKALIFELPWFVTMFYKLITPFIDPVTKSKMVFNEPLVNHIPAEQLIKQYGGNVDFEYKHEEYWPALNKLCEERRAAYKSRWEKAGSIIGESEAYLRGGDAKSLAGE